MAERSGFNAGRGSEFMSLPRIPDVLCGLACNGHQEIMRMIRGSGA
jgi:hypothetical protein